jgi:hypothetical protein
MKCKLSRARFAAEMKIGMVVGERCQTSEEIEAQEAALLANPALIEFRDEDRVVQARSGKDGTTN